MPRHRLIEVDDGSDNLTGFPSLKHYCSDFYAASNACIAKSHTGEIPKDACEPLFKAYKECKKRMNEWRLKYDRAEINLDEVPRKDGQKAPAVP